MSPALTALRAYPQPLVAQVRQLLDQGKLPSVLQGRYADAHQVRTDGALYDFVAELRARYLRKAPPVAKVHYDSTLHILRDALGTHTAISRVQGGRLKAKHEIRIASLFKEAPEEFLRMIVVHELAHFKERNHDKAFYQLCAHMEPAYHQYEFDLRVYLCHLEAGGEPLWKARGS